MPNVTCFAGLTDLPIYTDNRGGVRVTRTPPTPPDMRARIRRFIRPFCQVSRSLPTTTVTLLATPQQTSPDKSSHFPSTPAAFIWRPCWWCRASPSFASSPKSAGLIRGSCSSVQSFASGFLPAPSHDDTVASGSELAPALPPEDFHLLVIAHAGRTKRAPAEDPPELCRPEESNQAAIFCMTFTDSGLRTAKKSSKTIAPRTPSPAIMRPNAAYVV